MSGQRHPVAVHPVAALLTPEMKARVRATRFSHTFGHNMIRAKGNGCCGICPLAVAIGLSHSESPDSLAQRLGVLDDYESVSAIRDFVQWADRARSKAADVYVLLGCEP